MRHGWLRTAYRAVAALVLCSLAAFQLEALIADVCDGDATPAQLAAFKGAASDLPRDAIALATTHAPASPEAPASVPTHGAHACHCVHAHGGVLPRLETVAVATVPTIRTVPHARDLAPPSVTREPRLRPPLA